ncbi:hypothetical protein GCM10025771_22760 [Niveibacterium umoris]|uniref:Uncharacterized protein (TIGR02285 family) n=1 Tax=Niveibacterium umoris TaxID=1193620 RepID=A0A840BH56_9RHOO|nr:hypothetical protein [Niveibacterium umoris]MBB4012535.1 uncharacterized protein (TIGR02285 family) [Niveibacterium umoris]
MRARCQPTRSSRTLLMVLALASNLASAAEQTDLIWGVADWPPIYILKNGSPPASASELGEGLADRFIAALIAHMPAHYRHRFALVYPKSLVKQWAAGNNFCYASSLPSAERDKVTYRVRATPAPGIAIVLRRSDLARIGDDKGRVSLAALSKRSDLRGLAENGRLYGALDPLINAPGSNIQRGAYSRNGQHLNTLTENKADYVFEFPMVLDYLQGRGKVSGDLVTAQIVESPAIITGYVACTRNAWGHRVIRDIDAAVRAASADKALRTAQMRWLPAEYLEHHRREIEAMYDERAKRSEVAE